MEHEGLTQLIKLEHKDKIQNKEERGNGPGGD